jgi:hypothetical protein
LFVFPFLASCGGSGGSPVPDPGPGFDAEVATDTDPGFDPLDQPEAQALPGPLRTFLARALRPRPDDRFATAGEMAVALQQAFFPPVEPEPQEPPEPDPWRFLARTWPWFAAPLAALLVVGLGVLALGGGEPPEDSTPEVPTVVAETDPGDRPVPPAPPPAKVPREYAMRIETRPSGATVGIDGDELGVSPWVHRFRVEDEAELGRTIVVTARMDGYMGEARAVLLREAVAGPFEVTLRSLPKPRVSKDPYW